MGMLIANGYFYILGTVTLTVFSQLLIKWRMSSVYVEIPSDFIEKIWFFIRVFCDPFILLSMFSVFISCIFWMIAMTKFELSSVYPMIAVGLILLTSFLSIILFNESLNIYKLIGIVFSVVGVYILHVGNK